MKLILLSLKNSPFNTIKLYIPQHHKRKPNSRPHTFNNTGPVCVLLWPAGVPRDSGGSDVTREVFRHGGARGAEALGAPRWPPRVMSSRGTGRHNRMTHTLLRTLSPVSIHRHPHAQMTICYTWAVCDA